MKPTTSIVLPTRNAGPQFGELLERLTGENPKTELEIVVIDSGSTDGTVDLARKFGARVLEIPSVSFNHGLTRNLGIQNCAGEICVLLVQDAMPIEEDWLEALIRPFGSDPMICGVTTRQVPRPTADVVTNWEVVNHNRILGLESNVRFIPDWSAFESLSFEKKLFLCNFDNVCSAVRRSTWEEYPFRPLAFAEDLDWGVRVLQAGNKIAYEPGAGVIHSHERPALYHLRRYYVSGKLVPKILQCPAVAPPSSDDPDLFRQISTLLEEVFCSLFLWDQLNGYISGYEWRQWMTQAERMGFTVAANGRQKSEKMYRGFRKWLRLPDVLTAHSPSPTQAGNHPMRAHFFFLLREVAEGVPEMDSALVRHIMVHCLARTLGGFLGAHYLWSERQLRISPDLDALDSMLSLGV
jgi:rhamnosyltransferase